MSWIEYTSYKNYPSGELKSIKYECDVNKRIRENDGVNTAWSYRDYMQRNADKIMNYNTKNALTHTNNTLRIINRGYSLNTMQTSDLKRSYLNKTKTVSCPSIPISF